VVGRSPFLLKECTVGTGAACGSMFLNRGFEDLLRRKLGRWADEVLTTSCLEEAFSMFDTRVKCQFNPLSGDCEREYRIPLPGAPNVVHLGLDGGFLRLSKYNLFF
jgi:hypothetical protein